MGGGGGGGDAAASTPATTESAPAEAAAATPAPAAAPVEPAAPAVPDPVAPWVEAAQSRKKIPFWAVPALVALVPWAIVYALTLDTPTATEPSAFELGTTVYAQCANCHGATGGGVGAIPALDDSGDLLSIFPEPAEQVSWVALGSDGYKALGLDTYGEGKPVGAGMPAWGDGLTPEELMSVVLHERSDLNTEEFDIELWSEGFEETLAETLPPDQVSAYVAVLDEWAADPPEK